jgi:hypothetical protein
MFELDHKCDNILKPDSATRAKWAEKGVLEIFINDNCLISTAKFLKVRARSLFNAVAM